MDTITSPTEPRARASKVPDERFIEDGGLAGAPAGHQHVFDVGTRQGLQLGLARKGQP
jgi:hypothetical protein